MSHWHNILGIGEKSTKEEIMRAYRKKALEFHPDINKSPDASNRFKEINNAFRALTDSNFKIYNPPKPKPKPRYYDDILDNPSQEFKDSMAGQYVGGFDDENDDVFIDSVKYEKNDEYTPGKIKSWSLPKDIEINLWNKKQDPVELFWKEYERLKRNSAYENPEDFWEKLDDYMKKIMK